MQIDNFQAYQLYINFQYYKGFLPNLDWFSYLRDFRTVSLSFKVLFRLIQNSAYHLSIKLNGYTIFCTS